MKEGRKEGMGGKGRDGLSDGGNTEGRRDGRGREEKRGCDGRLVFPHVALATH